MGMTTTTATDPRNAFDVCKHCGRIKHHYTRNGTSRGQFGTGCKVQPQGFHFYVPVER